MTDRPVDGRGTARAAGLPDGIPDDGTVPMPVYQKCGTHRRITPTSHGTTESIPS